MARHNAANVSLHAEPVRTVPVPGSNRCHTQEQAMNDEQVMHTERTIPFSPQAVFDAFASADTLASWWGPDGFTNSFETFEFKVGGAWNFHMHGPDGQRYPNKNVFAALDPPARIVIRHDCPPYFTLTVRLAEVSDGTHLSWDQAFDDAQTAQAVKHIVVPANEQNLDRLTRALQRRAGLT
jgi:uncharacterized protein YndB with AHSA1/START domain